MVPKPIRLYVHTNDQGVNYKFDYVEATPEQIRQAYKELENVKEKDRAEMGEEAYQQYVKSEKERMSELGAGYS